MFVFELCSLPLLHQLYLILYWNLSFAEAGSWYEVTVQGYNREGSGILSLKAIHTLPASGSADVTASPFMGLEPPTNLEAEPTSPTSINLTWTPPQSAVNVSYYTVSYGLVQSSRVLNSSVYSYVSR
jgi:hypothetical protein